jgi:uncharacterized membrane protein (DUF485 family)
VLVFVFGLGKKRAVMTPPTQEEDLDIHSEAFLHRLMRRQLRLSISCAATFLVALLGLPLLNYFAPALMAKRVAGFTLTWLLLGVLFFPLVWMIAFYFIRRSIALEQAEAARVEGATKTESNPAKR